MLCPSGSFSRQWKTKEQHCLYFCSRKSNKHGRFITIVSVQGDNRSVIIFPEVAFNVGWKDIAFKIDRFIKEDTSPFITNFLRKADPEIPYAATLRASKWQSNDQKEAMVNTCNNKIVVDRGDASTENGLFARCVVGHFRSDLKEMPTLSDLRRWVVSTWKNTFGVNIYEMADSFFLFEFPNKYMAEQGTWAWKREKIFLEWWWSPVAGCCTDIQEKGWTRIRAMGLPLHLWSEKTFKAIGDQCGGMATNRGRNITEEPSQMGKVEDKRRG